jgi:hypothetical protein
VCRHAAAKEQAIAYEDYGAAGYRRAERQTEKAFDQAVAAWRQELEPPATVPPFG